VILLFLFAKFNKFENVYKITQETLTRRSPIILVLF